MQVGDLIRERGLPDIGLIIKINDLRYSEHYGILCPNGKIQWFSKHYVENTCRVVSENR